MKVPLLHGPAPEEGPAQRYGPVDTVAVLSDVHANLPALTAVLAQVEQVGPDLVVLCGDLTWGPEPRYDVAEAIARARAVGDPSADTVATLLTAPPSPAEVTARAEERVFSD
ncbi:MAG TPA: metallophosphoesterase family protein [Micromonosporaceae bacterium]|nr:metallophosphoesterase family protein [Micromonosporaceae bacterium]